MNGTIKAGVALITISLAIAAWDLVTRRAPIEGLGDGLVYQVELGERVHYLAGSFHLLRESDYPLPKPYEDAYSACEEIVFELGDSSGGGREGVADRFYSAGKYAAGQTLKDELGEEDHTRLVTIAGELGLDESAFDGYRPWLAALTVATARYVSLGARPEFGMEAFFESRAMREGKGIWGLETADEQIAMFTELEEGESAALLRQTLDDVSNSERKVYELIGAWRTGNSEVVERILNEGRERNPQFYQTMIDRRNRQWVEVLIGRMRETECMMVLVGAGHLLGDSGLVRLLEDRGARVTQVLQTEEAGVLVDPVGRGD